MSGSTSQRPRGVSLPSIHEMFPEHLMQRCYPGKQPGSPVSPSDPSSVVKPYPNHAAGMSSYGHSTKTPCDFPPHRVARLPHTRGVTSEQPLERDSESGQRHHHHAAHVQAQRSQHRQPSTSVHRAASQTASHHRQHYERAVYALDMLKTNLDSAASRSLKALHPSANEHVAMDVDESPTTSMRKLRPAYHEPKFPSPTDTSTREGPTFGSPHAAKILRNGPSSNLAALHPPEPLDDRRHCCPHCDKRFNRPSSLNIHVNTHTGAKPFQCEYPGCNRKFNVNSNMRRHWRNHMSARRRDGANALSRMLQPAGSSAFNNPNGTGNANQLSQQQSHPQLSMSEEEMEGEETSGSSEGSRSPSPASPCLLDEPQFVMPAQSPWSGGQLPRQTVTGRARAGSCVSPSTNTTLPYSESMAVVVRRGDQHGGHGGVGGRPRSCSLAGCDCEPMVGSLRPAFPEKK